MALTAKAGCTASPSGTPENCKMLPYVLIVNTDLKSPIIIATTGRTFRFCGTPPEPTTPKKNATPRGKLNKWLRQTIRWFHAMVGINHSTVERASNCLSHSIERSKSCNVASLQRRGNASILRATPTSSLVTRQHGDSALKVLKLSLIHI